ncbi:diacylglycerol/lipid kinase family protein [Pseudoneobacillus sp. C159]
MTKLHFIVNPKAGNGKAKTTWRMIEEKLSIRKQSYEASFTKKRGHAKELAKQLLDSATVGPITVIVVGGDGTMNEVVNGISHHSERIRLGLIPCGSGNDFSRGFGTPLDPAQALQSILILQDGPIPQFDFGQINLVDREHFFINSTGAGFDALISFDANKSKWKALLNRIKLGHLVYVIILLKHLFTYRCTTIELTIDGKKHTFIDTWFVTVSNQPFYGGGMKIAPSAQPNDQLLDITVVHQLSKIKLLFVFISVFWGAHIRFKEVQTFLAKSVSIQSNHPIFVHSDGEHIGTTPLQITVKSKPISILTQKG